MLRKVWAGALAGMLITTLALAPPGTAAADPSTSGPQHQQRAGQAAKLSVRLARMSTAGGDTQRQARAAGLPASGAGSVLRRPGGRLLAYVHVSDTSASTLRALRASGVEIVHVSPDYRVVTAAVLPGQVDQLTALSQVSYVSEALAPRIVPTDRTTMIKRLGRTKITAAGSCGSTTSEGDAILQSAAARQKFGVDGSGVTVGILSDSFDTAQFSLPTTAAQDVASGDLPGPGNPCGHTTPVKILHENAMGIFDEGRAMAQIVHDIAPGAGIAFATVDDGQYATADYIKEMYRAGVTVITDDVLYLEEPFYQRSVIGSAIGYVTARGVSYTSAAGNSNKLVGGKDASSYDTTRFRPTACPVGIPDRRHRVCHSFDPKKSDPALSYRVGGEANMYVDLHSAQPENGVTTDFDAYLLDHASHKILASDTENSLTSKTTGLTLFWNRNSGKASTVDLVFVRRRGTGTPAWRAVFIQLLGVKSIEKVSSPDTIGRYEIFGHNGDPDAITAAASNWADSSRAETYSSRGPVRWLFGPLQGTGIAKPLSKPRVIAKPDVAATDDVLTTFFLDLSGGPGPYRFAGSSAATPHVAGVLALLRQLRPTASPAQLRRAVIETAAPMAYGTSRSTGHGRVDAYRAARMLLSAP